MSRSNAYTADATHRSRPVPAATPRNTCGHQRFDMQRHHRRDHEGGIDDLAEPKLLDQVVLRTEHRCGRCAAVQQLVHPIGRRAAESQLDPLAAKERLQCLDRRVMTAGLVADMDSNIGQIFGRLDRRTRGNEHAARRDRVAFAPEPAEIRRGRLVHRPVAGATHRCLAPFLIGLVGAMPVVEICRRLGGDVRARKQAMRRQHIVRQALGGEIALFLRHPFLQAAMRVDDELGHAAHLRCGSGSRRITRITGIGLAPRATARIPRKEFIARSASDRPSGRPF